MYFYQTGYFIFWPMKTSLFQFSWCLWQVIWDGFWLKSIKSFSRLVYLSLFSSWFMNPFPWFQNLSLAASWWGALVCLQFIMQMQSSWESFFFFFSALHIVYLFSLSFFFWESHIAALLWSCFPIFNGKR